jgi:hypothetical protein
MVLFLALGTSLVTYASNERTAQEIAAIEKFGKDYQAALKEARNPKKQYRPMTAAEKEACKNWSPEARKSRQTVKDRISTRNRMLCADETRDGGVVSLDNVSKLKFYYDRKLVDIP